MAATTVSNASSAISGLRQLKADGNAKFKAAKLPAGTTGTAGTGSEFSADELQKALAIYRELSRKAREIRFFTEFPDAERKEAKELEMDGYSNSSLVHFNLKQYHSAELLNEMILKDDPKNGKAWLRRGNILAKVAEATKVAEGAEGIGSSRASDAALAFIKANIFLKSAESAKALQQNSVIVNAYRNAYKANLASQAAKDKATERKMFGGIFK